MGREHIVAASRTAYFVIVEDVSCANAVLYGL